MVGEMDPWPELPAGAVFVRCTEEWDAASTPAGLRRTHRIASGVWGRLVVVAGEVGFVVEEGGERRTVPAGGSLVIPPEVVHHVEPDDEARFAVEFYRAPR